MESKSLLPENAHSNSRFRPPWWMTLFLAIIVLAGICAYKGWSIQGYFDGWQAQPLVGQQKGTKPVECPLPRDLSAAPSELTDQRGRFTLTIAGVVSSKEITCCLATPASGRAGSDYVAVTTVRHRGAFASTASALAYRGGHIRMIFGRMPEGMVHLVVHTRAHGDVDATVQGGWFAAWWPTRPYESRLLADTNPRVDLISRGGILKSVRLQDFPGNPN